MAEVVLDTCCLINLCAVADLRQWLPTLELSWHVPSAVMAEALFLRMPDDRGQPGREKVDVQELVDAGLLLACDVQPGKETDLYVRLARVLDDGEAMALAISKARGRLLATDDRKARRHAAELDIRTISTPELMKRWADINAVPRQNVRAALRRIEDLARFRPAETLPLYRWWIRQIAGGA